MCATVCRLAMQEQPPDYTLPGMVPPHPSRSRDTRNPCAICLEPLSGPAEANAELPDTLQRMTTCQHQLHLYCCAKHVCGRGANDLKLYCPLCRAAVTADEAEAMIDWIDLPDIQLGMDIISRVLDALGHKIAFYQLDHWWQLVNYAVDTEPHFALRGFRDFVTFLENIAIRQSFLTMLESMLEAEINATLGQGASTPELTRVGILRLQSEAQTWRGRNGDTLVHTAVRANKPEYVLALTLDMMTLDPRVRGVESQFVHRNVWMLPNDLGESVALLAAASAVNNAPFTLLYTPPPAGLETTLPVDMLRLVYDVLSNLAVAADMFFDEMMDEVPNEASPLYPQTGRAVLETRGGGLDAATRALVRTR